uniref:Uncharacterized protein n=1 Tax=Romanomermis culicivorax TaxID=13658 RepID=A0A915KS30_ROMCU
MPRHTLVAIVQLQKPIPTDPLYRKFFKKVFLSLTIAQTMMVITTKIHRQTILVRLDAAPRVVQGGLTICN